MKTIVVGCDNAAVDMKNILVEYLLKKGLCVDDVGCSSEKDDTYYPLVAKAVCEKIINSDYEKEGLLVCGTGIGMAMTANKFKGIRAAVCHDIFSTERARLSNDGNVICMGARVVAPELAKRLLDEWLKLTFQDGSSTPKVEAIKNIEQETMQ